ncbi:hypothetical protein MA16_Dca012052 [Dendrobium catenatum]|uniref:Uncharacterized protein n=1 Tax=Dendrobium catenatum TaxID=906689 RepID=A0A2I0WW30_9ASPA|nr:hypothetical protein MA16_Dca012052 [Dendrobium catenatum]
MKVTVFLLFDVFLRQIRLRQKNRLGEQCNATVHPQANSGSFGVPLEFKLVAQAELSACQNIEDEISVTSDHLNISLVSYSNGRCPFYKALLYAVDLIIRGGVEIARVATSAPSTIFPSCRFGSYDILIGSNNGSSLAEKDLPFARFFGRIP